MSGFAEALEQATDSGDLLSGGAFSQETAADLDGSGLPVPGLRLLRCRLLRLHLHGLPPGGMPALRHLLEELPPLRLQMGWGRSAPFPVEGQHTGGDASSLCQLYQRQLGAYFREGL